MVMALGSLIGIRPFPPAVGLHRQRRSGTAREHIATITRAIGKPVTSDAVCSATSPPPSSR